MLAEARLPVSEGAHGVCTSTGVCKPSLLFESQCIYEPKDTVACSALNCSTCDASAREYIFYVYFQISKITTSLVCSANLSKGLYILPMFILYLLRFFSYFLTVDILDPVAQNLMD